MDNELLVGFKVLVGIGIACLIMLVNSLIGAIWLRIAALWLRFGNIPFSRAFNGALLSNIIYIAISFSLNFIVGLHRGIIFCVIKEKNHSIQLHEQLYELLHFAPGYLFYIFIVSLVLTATIFCRVLPPKDSEVNYKFGDCLALSGLYYSLSVVFGIIIVTLLYIIFFTFELLA